VPLKLYVKAICKSAITAKALPAEEAQPGAGMVTELERVPPPHTIVPSLIESTPV
jgi:hypothetical protein